MFLLDARGFKGMLGDQIFIFEAELPAFGYVFIEIFYKSMIWKIMSNALIIINFSKINYLLPKTAFQWGPNYVPLSLDVDIQN